MFELQEGEQFRWKKLKYESENKCTLHFQPGRNGRQNMAEKKVNLKWKIKSLILIKLTEHIEGKRSRDNYLSSEWIAAKGLG